ncbi:AP2 domain-containing protein [Streptomyces sp. LB8]|uniref:HNH endonuclease n=1 Tax=Streptomyces sp. LB8 TaxID=3042509 RepID=UPI002648EBE4|nr:HNH endonuclease [Streptomyces sp. LB8]MDN5380706.1 AP2 domain-containing protein [Streptomyces sp. LB8]
MARAHVEVPAKNGDDGYATVLLDLEDAERLAGRRLSIGSHGYAQMWERPHVMLLHRWVMGVMPGTGYRVIVDHINRNTLDCRRGNLRLVTPSASNLNRGIATRELPVGVYRTRSGRYSAQIKRHRVTHRLGTYDTPEQALAAVEAARAELDRDAFTPAAIAA